MLRKILITGLMAGVAVLMGANALLLAADLGRPYPPARAPVVLMPETNAPAREAWSGFYLGGFGLYGQGSARQEMPGFEQSIGTNGWGGGVTAGYNWQWGPLVAGLNGSASWMDVRGSLAHTSFGIPTVDSARLSSLATLGGRLGLALGPVLLYGQAGGAYGTVHAGSGFDFGGFYQSNQKQGAAGHYWGGGLEYRLTDSWSLNADHKQVDLGINKFVDNTGFRNRSTVEAGLTSLGLNYRF